MSLEHPWRKKTVCSALLRPVSWCYRAVVALRRRCYQKKYLNTFHPSVPVVVVGNLVVGGVGKTPCVVAIAQALMAQGQRVAIVSRGYKGRDNHTPQFVNKESDPVRVGDEPVLMAQKINCPIVICKDRVQAVRAVLDHHSVDVILSDDGLQHLAMGRWVEVVVMPGRAGWGNGLCLPAGPLREPISRLQTVDFILQPEGQKMNNRCFSFKIEAAPVYHLKNTKRLWPSNIHTVHAVCGIGHPQRFFDTLRDLGLRVIEHPYPDHHAFIQEDLMFDDGHPVIITEKDAVKCRFFDPLDVWCLPIRMNIEPAWLPLLKKRIAEFKILKK